MPKRNEVEQILDFLFDTMGTASVYFIFGVWVKKRYPQLFEEFVKNAMKQKDIKP